MPIRHEPAWWWYESALRRDERVQVVVDLRARAAARRRPRPRRRRREDRAGELDALDEPVAVGPRVAEVVRVDRAASPRVGAREPDPAARGGLDDAGEDADRVRVALADDDVERDVHERDLEVRAAFPLPPLGLEEERRLGEVLRAAAAPAACTRG